MASPVTCSRNCAVAATFRYDPYGVLLTKAGPAMNVGTYRYAAGQWDEASGLQYHLNRYYSPGQGRFLNRDPIAEAGGVNMYAYTSGDPVNFTDAAGHSRSGTPHRVVYPPAKPQAMRLGQTLIRPVGENEAGEIVWQLGHVVEGKYVMGGGRGGTRTEWRQEGALFRGNFLTAAEFTAEAYKLTRSRAQAALDQDERAESIERAIGGLETARNFVPFATAVDMAHQGKWDEFNKAITVDLAILASGGVLKIAQLAKISRIGNHGARSMDELRLLAADQQWLLAVPLSEAALQARNASSAQLLIQESQATRRTALKLKFGHPDSIDEVVNTAFARRAENAVRDWHAKVFQSLSRSQQKQITSVVAAYDERYGAFKVAFSSKHWPEHIHPRLVGSFTNCAEAHAANRLLLSGSRFTDLRFVQTMSPSRAGIFLIPKEFCDECISTFFPNLCKSPVYGQSPVPMLVGKDFHPFGVP